MQSLPVADISKIALIDNKVSDLSVKKPKRKAASDIVSGQRATKKNTSLVKDGVEPESSDTKGKRKPASDTGEQCRTRGSTTAKDDNRMVIG